jgi:hypothetical protein
LMPSTFPKSCKKTTPQPLIYSPHKYKTARDRHFENQIEYWTSLYLLASIHPPTPAKKNKNKNQQRKKIHKFVILRRRHKLKAEAGRKPIILIPEISYHKVTSNSWQILWTLRNTLRPQNVHLP